MRKTNWTSLALLLTATAIVLLLIACTQDTPSDGPPAQQTAPSLERVLTTRVFNFGPEAVRIHASGDVEEVRLLSVSGEAAGPYPVYEITDDEGADFFFRPTAAPAGSYRVVVLAAGQEGPPSKRVLEVRSPEFQLTPKRVDRTVRTLIQVRSLGGYPTESVRRLTLRARPDGAGSSSVGLVSISGGRFFLEAGAVLREGEAVYDVELEGIPVRKELGADAKPATIEIFGPAKEADEVENASDKDTSDEDAVRGRE